ncbi:MAG: hypothetical protein JJU27_05885 [Gammaproteobacteria bacterium]|nr:hypothetical protein [Gammaproteobacteria bacterium]
MMIDTQFGSMARLRSFQRHGSALKQTISTLGNELTTGAMSDKTRHLKGDVSLLASINRSLDLSATHQRIATETLLLLEVQQSTINDIQIRTEDSFAELLGLGSFEDSKSLRVAAKLMQTGLEHVTGRLNTTLAGQFLMAGMEGDSAALPSADALLDAIEAGLPADPTVAELQDHVSQWFAPGGGFDDAAQGYGGAPPRPEPVKLGDGYDVTLDITAEDAAFRETLAAFATGALVSRGYFTDDPGAQRALFGDVTMALAAANQQIIGLSARTGIQEELAAQAKTRASAEESAMKIAQAELLGSDPYATATQLEQSMSQLDMIYNLTARLSRLSLADYLR